MAREARCCYEKDEREDEHAGHDHPSAFSYVQNGIKPLMRAVSPIRLLSERLAPRASSTTNIMASAPLRAASYPA